MTYTFHSSSKKLGALALVFLPMAGFLIKVGIEGNRIVPPQMREDLMRFVVVFCPMILAGILLCMYIYLLATQAGRRLDIGSIGVTLTAGNKSTTVGWASMVVHRSQSSNMMSSSLISDGQNSFRIQRFFWPDHDDILNRIERTVKHNRGGKTVKM